MKNGALFPQGTPPGKIGHFCKNVKNPTQNQNTGGFIILQKEYKILEKKTFWQIWTIFVLGVSDVPNSSFLGVTTINYG